MDISITVNLWFVVCLCLACALTGTIIGARAASRGERNNNRHRQQLPPLYDRYQDRY